MLLIISPLIIDHTCTETKIFEHTLTKQSLQKDINFETLNSKMVYKRF